MTDETVVCKVIRELIESGELPPGRRLPPVSEISRELSVTYSCVRTAYSKLAEQKLVQASGAGYLVSPRAVPPEAPGPPFSPGRPDNDVLDQVFLKVGEIARTMRVSPMTVYRLVHSGELEAIRVGRSFRVPEPAVHAFMRGNILDQGGESHDG